METKELTLKSPEYLFICALGFITMTSTGMVFPIIPLLAKRLTEATWLIGFVGTAFWLTRLGLEIPTGLLSDRISKRKIMLTGMGLTCISLALTAVVTNIYQLIVLRACAAIGSVFFFVASLSYIAQHFPTKTKGKALGILQAIEFSALTLANPLGGYLATIKGFRFPFIVAALFVACVLLPTVILGLFKESMDVVLKRDPEREREHSIHSIKDSLRLLLVGNILIASIAIFLAQLPDNLLSIIVPLYAEGVLGMKPDDIGIVLATRGIGVGLGSIFGGFLFDKFYPKLHFANYALAFGIAGIGIKVFVSTSALQILSLVSLGLGASFGIVYATTPALASVSTTKSVGTSMGAWRTFYDLGGCIFPVMLTTIGDFAGLSAPFHVSSYAMFSCMILFVVLTFVNFIKRQRLL